MRQGFLTRESVLIATENHRLTSSTDAKLRALASGDAGVPNSWEGWLRSTLPGEYVSLLIMAMASMTVSSWALCAAANFSFGIASAALTAIVISLWVASRSVGLLAGSAWTAPVTVTLIFVAVGVFGAASSKTPEWLMYGPVGRASLLIQLLVVLFLDGMDFIAARSRHTPLPELRRLKGRCLLIAVGSIWALWAVGVPLLQTMWWTAPLDGKPQMEQMGFVQHVGFRFGEGLVTFCFFLLGANIGSFLNVVAWRLPQGLSVVPGDSRCPSCEKGILRRDNVPIVGWLFLGGECRNCRAPISSRYPTVEAITGGPFLLLFLLELISGGANLPLRPINSYRGVLWIIMYPRWDLISLYLYHCFVFCCLLTWTLMLCDGSRISHRMKIFCVGVTVITPLIWNHLWLVPVDLFPWASTAYFGIHGSPSLISISLGMLAGVILSLGLAAVAIRLARRTAPQPRTTSKILLLALIGLAFGWQAVLLIFVTAELLRRVPVLENFASHAKAAICLMAVAGIHHCLWRILWNGF